MTDRHTTSAKAFVALGHALFAALSVLALVHWQLRIIHVDTAWQVLKWIQVPGLQFEAHRYSAIVPQLCVASAASLGVSLQALLVVASLSHVCFPWLLFGLVAHVLRRPWHATGLALATVLCTRLTFYGVVLEAHYLLSYPLVFAAALDAARSGQRNGAWAWSALAATVLVHPLGAPIAFFVLGDHMLRNGRARTPVVMAVAVVLWWVIGRWLFSATGYEQGLYDGMGSGARSLFSDLGAAADFFFRHSWRDTITYLPWWLVLATVLVLGLRQRNGWPTVWMLASVVALLLITFITYHNGDSAVMMEKNFLPLATLVVLPLVWLMNGSDERARWLAFPALLLLCFVQFRGISFASKEMARRFDALHGLVDDARASGPGAVRVTGTELNERGIHVHWAVPAEVLLLSATDGPDASVIMQVQGATMSNLPFATEELDSRWFAPASGPEHVLSSH